MIWPELVPNLHPFAVHFAVALVLTSTAFFIVAKVSAARSWAGMLLLAARCNLYVGAVFALLALATGWLAYLDVQPGPRGAFATLTLHRSSAAVAWWLSLFAAIGVWRVRHRAPGWILIGLLLGASASIAFSALYGAQLTYRYGIGIERPKEMPRMPVAQNDATHHRAMGRVTRVI
jgi:uncharacterized membrane protein